MVIYIGLLTLLVKTFTLMGFEPNENVAGFVIIGFIIYVLMSAIEHLLERKRLHENHHS